jgi:hypothetical protein
MIDIRINVTIETLLVIIICAKGRRENWTVAAITIYSVVSLLNSIDLLLIDRKDESIVIFFLASAGIPMLLGIAAKDFALLGF